MAPEVSVEHTDVRRYEALLQMADHVVHHGALPELFKLLATRVAEVTPFRYVNFALYDPAKKAMEVHLRDGQGHRDASVSIPSSAYPSGWVWQNQQPLTISDLTQTTIESAEVEVLRSLGLRSHCIVPVSTSAQKLGALGMGSPEANVVLNGDLRLLQSVAQLVALAVENDLFRGALRKEIERQDVLAEIVRALDSCRPLAQSFAEISSSLRKYLHHEYASIATLDAMNHCSHRLSVDCTQRMHVTGEESVFVPSYPADINAGSKGGVMIYRRDQFRQKGTDFPPWLVEQGITVLCCVPLFVSGRLFGTLKLGYVNDDIRQDDLSILPAVAAQISHAIEAKVAHESLSAIAAQVTQKIYLEEEARGDRAFSEIVGDSPSLKHILAQTKLVAPSDATVLILGETGTGKELIARAVHRMSSRKDGNFIKLNCAAIPTGLLESEIFGHERGAFTGAVSQKIGRLELAHNGTLFLDEIGDIALELQPKLLRVLQDQEFERLGGNRTIRVNVRLVAATNRELAKSVEDKEFRSDLYYRLNVFPLRMPALRERRQDIPMLVQHFVRHFASVMHKDIDEIPTETMNRLVHWHWPGNIRELENIIERSTILTDGNVLRVPLADMVEGDHTDSCGTLESREREYIQQALRDAGGVVAGEHGAAARLGLKRTTLQSKMLRLGISRNNESPGE